jgi:UDP-sugar transporter A1/2/3
VQQTLQPLLVRKAHNVAEKANTPIVDSTIVLITEIIRLSICCIHVILRNQSVTKAFTDIFSVFTNNKKETVKVCVPALVYVVQNNLYFFALKHLDATMFSVSF